MKGKKAVTAWAAGLLLVLYLLIFGFSAQDGETSGSMSLYISEKCTGIVNHFTKKGTDHRTLEAMAAYFEHPIRKMAHFGEYACMGVLVYIMWSPWIRLKRKLFFLTGTWVLLSAAADELHQFFVPGRYCSFSDVILDTCGGCFGALVCAVIFKWRSRLLSKRDRDT